MRKTLGCAVEIEIPLISARNCGADCPGSVAASDARMLLATSTPATPEAGLAA